MGYCTDYSLSSEDNNETVYSDAFEKDFSEVTGGYYVDSLEEVKWYGWHDDMIKLSAMYPGIMFTLDGNGEDGEDVWREYFRDGMSHPANIETIYEKFDESKLK